MLELVLGGALGASIGSFLGVYAERWPKGRSLFNSSSCNHCHEKIRWFDLIPVVSFVLLRGRCRTCRSRIPWSAPVSELASLGLTVLVVGSLGLSISSLLILVELWALLLILVTDWRSFLIPDGPVLIAAGCGAGIALLGDGQIQDELAAGAMLSVALWLVGKATSLATGKASLGFGDVKLAGALGLTLGMMEGFLAIWIAAILGLLYRISGYRAEEPRIPFGALMAVSGGGVLLAERGIIDLSWII